MARYTQTVTLNKPEDFVNFMMNDYLQKQNFTQNDYKGESVWRAGDAAFEGYRYLKWAYNSGIFTLEAWFPTISGGENALDGVVGALPKKVYKDSLEQLITLLQQELPQNGAAPVMSAEPSVTPNTDGTPVQGTNEIPSQNTDNGSAQTPQYQAPIAVQTVDNSKSAILCLVMGILSLVMACCIPLLGVVFGIVAIVNAKNAKGSSKEGMATAGKICGIIGTSLSAIIWIFNFVVSIVELMG